MKDYENIKGEIVEISKIISELPATIQEKAFDVLINAYIKEKPEASREVVQISADIGDLENIATVDAKGAFHFVLRDPKAKNSKDAARRVIYVLIRTYTLLKNTSTVSRKEVINPELDRWRLNNGNTRGMIVADKGLIKNGDDISLDKFAQEQADMFISQINDSAIAGKWKVT